MTGRTTGIGGLVTAVALAIAAAGTGCGDDSMANPGSATAPALEALGAEGGGRGHGGLAGRLECRLGLTDAQTAEVRGILKAEFGDLREGRRAGMKGRRAGAEGAPFAEEWKAKSAARAIERVERIEKVSDRIRATLTAEQVREFNVVLQDMRAVALEGGGPVANLSRKLDLTEGQKAQLEALFEARRAEHKATGAERQALREEARSPGRDVREFRKERRGARQEFREGRGEFHQQLRSILTSEQQARLDADRAKWQDCKGS